MYLLKKIINKDLVKISLDVLNNMLIIQSNLMIQNKGYYLGEVNTFYRQVSNNQCLVSNVLCLVPSVLKFLQVMTVWNSEVVSNGRCYREANGGAQDHQVNIFIYLQTSPATYLGVQSYTSYSLSSRLSALMPFTAFQKTDWDNNNYLAMLAWIHTLDHVHSIKRKKIQRVASY